tara:strand:- start:612 stop:962 length:351 start_codon:yes stop_codon:yes gene_type:complete
MKKLALLSSLLVFIIPLLSKNSVKASPQEAGKMAYIAQRNAFTISYCASIRGHMTKDEINAWMFDYINSKVGKYARVIYRNPATPQQIETMIRRTLDHYGGCDGALNALGYPEFTK